MRPTPAWRSDLCRRHGFSEASCYLWRSKFGDTSVSDAKRLKELESENARLKKLLAEQVFENDVIEDRSAKKAIAASVRWALVREMTERGLSERRFLALAQMSAGAFRYEPQPDRNVGLCEQIQALATGTSATTSG